jgi:hypothetical protein
MADALIKMRTVATAAITWITIAGLILTAIMQALTAEAFDNAGAADAVEQIVRWLTIGIGVLATIARVVRRVTEVIPEHRGLTPIERPWPAAWPPPPPPAA